MRREDPKITGQGGFEKSVLDEVDVAGGFQAGLGGRATAGARTSAAFVFSSGKIR